MSKYDRQGVRTARDLERKYDLGGGVQAAQKYAAAAAQSAAAAQAAAERLNEGYSQAELVSRLNGNSSAFTIEGGVPYIDAAYIKGLTLNDAALAQATYTAMETNTLTIVPTKETIASWYNAGLWNQSHVYACADKILTDADIAEILGEG